jgi:hypothetical protein
MLAEPMNLNAKMIDISNARMETHETINPTPARLEHDPGLASPVCRSVCLTGQLA